MRLLFDQNISHRILSLLSKSFEKSTSIKMAGLIDKSDREIWEYAKSNHFTIVTQDSDFNELNSLFGFPPKVIWIRIGNARTNHIAQILETNYPEIAMFIENGDYGCFEIVSV